MPRSDISNIGICAKKLYNKIDFFFGKSFSGDFFGFFGRIFLVFSLSYRFFMNRKIFFAIICFLCIGFTTFDVLGIGKFFHIRGQFIPLDTWTGGHPGKILFDI